MQDFVKHGSAICIKILNWVLEMESIVHYHEAWMEHISFYRNRASYKKQIEHSTEQK